MPDSRAKVLAQLRPANTTAASLYSPPANRAVELTKLVICNQTGSAATKALQDALALGRHGSQHTTWSEALAAYNDERSAAGNALVELGRRIGLAQVEETPDWGSMSPADFDEWTRQTLSGERLYLYRDL